MRDYSVRLLEKLLETYSPSGNESRIADLLSDEMCRIGFSVTTDEVGNVIGEAGTGTPSIMLCGHMDTVPGLLPVKTEGGKLYGRGAVDAKSPLAMMLVASARMIKRRYPRRLQLVAVVDEEGTGSGIRNIIRKGISADYAIFGEPSGTSNITIGYKGSLHLRVTCETETGHAAAPWLFENAIEHALNVWRTIGRIRFNEEDMNSRFYSITSCLTKIDGGNGLNEIPSICTLHADIRIPPRVTAERFMDRAGECVQQYRQRNPRTKVTMELEDKEEPFETDKSSALVRSFKWAIRKVTSQPAILVRKTGTGDINAFAAAVKRPMIVYGPGDSRLDHTAYEHVRITEYLDAIEVCQEALNRLTRIDSLQRQNGGTKADTKHRELARD